MKIPDLNVLLYAVNEDSAHHQEAQRWLDEALNGSDALGFAWMVIVGFIRLSTRALVFPRPLEAGRATAILTTWLDSPFARPVEPTERHLRIFSDLIRSRGAAGNTTNDAHLAALAIEHGAEVATFDRGFGRFPDLRVSVLG